MSEIQLSNYKLNWEELQPKFEEFENASINSPEELLQWLKDFNAFLKEIQEAKAWAFINMTRDTANKEYEKAYVYVVKELSPQMTRYEHRIWKKYYESPYRPRIRFEGKEIFDKKIKNSLELYNEENIRLKSQESLLAQKYSQIQGGLTVTLDGKEMTLQQAGVFLKNKDRSVREKTWREIEKVTSKVADQLDDLLSEQIEIRNRIARNAGFKDFVEYRYRELERFDYTPEQVEGLHKLIEERVTPVYRDLLEYIRKNLGVEKLKPWDLSVDIFSERPLKPFNNARELIDASLKVLEDIRPSWAGFIRRMDEKGLLDLESRKGKAPGGYQYPLYQSGMPFIFMNAVGTHSDLVTFMHEAGHAVHSFLASHIEMLLNLDVSPELAEVASMSMEFLTSEAWKYIYTDEKELKNAFFNQYTRPIKLLVWIAVVDSFQHWLYRNPEHSKEERRNKFAELYKKYMGESVDWTGYESALAVVWHKQLHIFEIPFYYIEYGIAQIGALQTWRNYLRDKEEAIRSFEKYMSLGYTKSIPEIYEAGNIKFWFSGEDVEALFGLLRQKLREIGIEF